MAETYTPIPGYETAAYTDDQAVCITSDKKIGSMAGQISIQGEANSQYILYEMNRYHDGVDLSDKLLQIHYERRDGAGGNSTPVNVCMSDSRIRFGWVVPGSATVLDGVLKVMPFATGLSPMGDTYIIKTLYVEYRINAGLAVSGGIEEPEEDWYQGFVSRMAQYMDTAKTYASLAAQYERNAEAYRNQSEQMAGAAVLSASNAAESAVNAAESAQAIEDRESEAAKFAGQSQSYAVGTGGEVRENDDADCARSYYERAKQIAENLEEGSLTFDIDKQAPTFTESSERENIESNEKFPTLFGKIKKFFTDLKEVAFSGSYNDLSDTPDIPVIPGSLPANGGNADTVGGKSADDLLDYTNFTNAPAIPVIPDSLPANGGNAETVGGKTADELLDYGNFTNKPELFSGNYSDLNGAPEIPSIPSSLPANGGNADTIEGKDLNYLMNYNNMKNKPETPTAETLGIISTQVTVQLSTSWAGTEAPYSQTVAVSGVTSGSVVDIDVASTVTAEQLDAYINAKIVDGGQAAGSITLKAFGDKPEVVIPVKIVVRKV